MAGETNLNLLLNRRLHLFHDLMAKLKRLFLHFLNSVSEGCQVVNSRSLDTDKSMDALFLSLTPQ